MNILSSVGNLISFLLQFPLPFLAVTRWNGTDRWADEKCKNGNNLPR